LIKKKEKVRTLKNQLENEKTKNAKLETELEIYKRERTQILQIHELLNLLPRTREHYTNSLMQH